MTLAVRLTPFEEYMLLDGSSAYPMNCYVRVRFSGRFDRERFARAARVATKHHPLFAAHIVKSLAKKYYWELPSSPTEIIIWQSVDCEIPAVNGRQFDLFCEPPLRLHLNELPSGQTDLFLEFHHAASDGQGLYQWLASFLNAYHEDAVITDSQLDDIQHRAWDALATRGRFRQTWREILRELPSQLWGLQRARTFLFRRPESLVPYQPRERNAPPPVEFPFLTEIILDSSELLAIVARAKQAGVTLNDIFLTAAYQALFAWRDKCGISTQQPLRIAVPTSLRRNKNNTNKINTAANCVSMVFLDRTARDATTADKLLLGIHREMKHIKRHDLGWAFIFGLTAFKRIFGGFEMMMRQERCWSSCVVSNHGEPFASATLPILPGENGEQLHITEFSGAPPIRPWTAVGINIATYNNRVFISLHSDPLVFSRSDAAAFLKTYRDFVVGRIDSSPKNHF